MKIKNISVVFFLLVVLLSITFFIEIKAPSIIYAMAEDKAKSIAIQAINNSVGEVIDGTEEIYKELVDYRYDDDGNIISVNTNINLTNTVEGLILDSIAKKIDKASRCSVKVPAGTLTGSDLLTGRGPPITFYINLSGNARSTIENLFESTGINQTRHQIQIRFEIDMSIVMSGKHSGVTVENTVVIGETIIVGKIPESYVRQPVS
ncbi:MAG: sporulation protein YunB [Clostridia bacterium]|nr:sporulation protein YunB [Clostridia bacterium]